MGKNIIKPGTSEGTTAVPLPITEEYTKDIRERIWVIGKSRLNDNVIDSIHQELDSSNEGIELGESVVLGEKIGKIHEHMPEISQMFCYQVFNEGAQKQLFESPGVITFLGESEQELAQYKNFTNLFTNNKEFSPVAEKYEHSFMQKISVKKAIMHYLVSHMPLGILMSTGMIQQYLKNLTDHLQYRGGYRNKETGEVYAVSGCSLNENIVEKIFRQANIEGNLDEIAEKIGCGRVDLLAGIGDELMARLISHPRSEWEEQIQIVVADIKDHIQKNSLGLLC